VVIPVFDSDSETERGQVYTLEAIIGAILLLTALLFALQSILITPATPGTIDSETRAQLTSEADDVVSAASANGSLTDLARFWNTSQDPMNRTFYNPDPTRLSVDSTFGYGQDRPPGEFGAMLNQTFSQRGLSYNVYIEYQLAGDWTESDRVVVAKQGVPTDNAVSVSYPVALYDDQRITAPTSSETLANETKFYAPDVDADGPLYNVVTFRVIVW
jgi:hypothetical protein